MLTVRGQKIDKVIEIRINDQALIERISSRYSCTVCGATYNKKFKPTKIEGVCDNCGSKALRVREDDRADTVAARLSVYNKQTAPLLPYYEAKKVLFTIDGMAPMEDVTSQIKTLLN